jgi:hypothetical protein
MLTSFTKVMEVSKNISCSIVYNRESPAHSRFRINACEFELFYRACNAYMSSSWIPYGSVMTIYWSETNVYGIVSKPLAVKEATFVCR